MPQATLLQLSNANQLASTQVKDRTLAYTAALWDASPSYRDADIDRLISQIMPATQAAQLQVAHLENAYIGAAALNSGLAWSPTIDQDALLNYRGVAQYDVYRRAAVTLYTALAGGSPFADAVIYGAARMASIVATNIQQSRNRQAQQALENSGFTHYRRALTGLENCALCVIASTQVYRKETLMPIHPGCDCGVEPLSGGSHTGTVLDPDLLESTHALIDAHLGSTDRGARDLGREKVSSAGQPLSDFTDLIIANDHGELGPTLAWRSDKFTSAADIAAL